MIYYVFTPSLILSQYHVEASECCIKHYNNPLFSCHGVWINFAVRVVYSAAAYNAVSGSENRPTKAELRWGVWWSRWFWCFRDPESLLKTRYRTRQWRKHNLEIEEPGVACVSDLAMVLTENRWAIRGSKFE